MYTFRNNILEVLSLFRNDYKKRMYLREISYTSKIPLKTCQNTLAKLENQKILKSKIEGKNKYFSLNIDNIKTKLLLLQTEIYMTDLFIEKYPQINMFMKELKTNNPVIVFGSFAKFKAETNSDIDLLIITEKEETLPFHLLSIKTHKTIMKEKTFLKALKEQENLVKE
ncbi:MAG: nucleotidyltransferase domain-containing protein, partial [Nanoarchaeota archaeon]|nr:nucleotidyltransferase domain-containing protein [Nanoarchaeota archaeon]MBU1855257.1 nucleotidyltransferase domain-containing protein [Nanoarchaeota archaeon]